MANLRRITAFICAAFLATTIAAPTSSASRSATGEGRIVTAPGLVATLTAGNTTIGTLRPARTSFNTRNRSIPRAKAVMRFPVDRITNEGQIVLAGSMVLTTPTRSVTLRNITVDLDRRVVYVSVREFFGLTVEAFTIANTPTITRMGATTRVTDARLVISQSAGQQLSQILNDPVFGPGTFLGTASMRFTTP